jgi:hypothetical protein
MLLSYATSAIRTVRAWRGARTLTDLGELTARWLEGDLTTQPHHAGPPCDETRDLIPVLAAVNRSGYLTECSQPGIHETGDEGDEWAQRAAVSGFTTASTAARLAAALWPGLVVIVHPPGTPALCANSIGSLGMTVTTCNGEPFTVFGIYLPPSEIEFMYRRCHRDARATVLGAHQVTIIDPVWGRNDVLWPALATVMDSERSQVST